MAGELDYLPKLPRDKSIGIGCIGAGFIMADCHLVAYRSAGFNHKLDRFGDLLMAVIFFLLAWRCGAATINARESMGASMLLGFPDWIVCLSMCIPFALTAFIAAMQSLSKFNPEEASA